MLVGEKQKTAGWTPETAASIIAIRLEMSDVTVACGARWVSKVLNFENSIPSLVFDAVKNSHLRPLIQLTAGVRPVPAINARSGPKS